MSIGADKGAAHLSSVICVSLRIAASAEAPLSLKWLPPRLQARGGVGMLGEQPCQGALTERQKLKSRFEPQAYYSRRSVELPLRPSARAAPPSGPMPFPPRLRARERLVMGSVNGR